MTDRSASPFLSVFETKATIGLAMIYAARMLGVFMVLPVFMIYAPTLEGFSSFLAGLALGIYGLCQAVMQIPLGSLSDRFGRKPVIAAGLFVFFLGSILAATTDSMLGMVIARALQGVGAVSAATLALLADLTTVQHRTRVMAIIGMSIGASFALAIIVGPIVASIGGLSSIFWTVAALAALGIVLLFTVVPNPAVRKHETDIRWGAGYLKSIISNKQLLRLNYGVFVLHSLMTATFVVFPTYLLGTLELSESKHWVFYLSSVVFSFFCVFPVIMYAEKKHRIKQVMAIMISLLFVVLLLLAMETTVFVVAWLLLFGYFLAFNFLEASLPSLVTKISPANMKGTATGVFSTAQFLGIFVGGTLGGYLANQVGGYSVYLLSAGCAAIWLILTLSMDKPEYLSTKILHLNPALDAAQAMHEISALAGVREATHVDGIAYLKIDKAEFDAQSVQYFDRD